MRKLLVVTLWMLLWACSSEPQPEGDMSDSGDMSLDVIGDESLDRAVDLMMEPDGMSEPDVPVDMGPTLSVGAPCLEDRECIGGRCLKDDPWVDGYCAEVYCSQSDVCDEPKSICITHPNMPINFCPKTCLEDTECRQGYRCIGHHVSKVCLPESWAHSGLPDGAACESDDACTSGTCVETWQGGYCTGECEKNVDCAAQGEAVICARRKPDLPKQCLRRCQYGSDCRFGYTCLAVSASNAACVGGTINEVLNPQTLPFQVTCTAGGSLNYRIASDTIAYSVFAFSTIGRRTKIKTLTLPDGRVIDPLTRDRNRAQIWSYNNWFLNLAVPWVDAYQMDVMEGEHIAQIEGVNVCLAVFEKKRLGKKIDLNVYFAKFDGLSAANAKTHPKFVQVMEKLKSIFRQNMLEIGEVRYLDLPEGEAERASFVRSETQINRLGEHTLYPAGGLDGAMSINVYLVESLFDGVLGFSTGVPGMPGVHKTKEVGVVATLGDLDESDEYYASIIAHELGHYLGLRHTTERDGRTVDKFTDTPQCLYEINRDIWSCADAGNLMFPVDVDSTSNRLSAGQIRRIEQSPWSK